MYRQVAPHHGPRFVDVRCWVQRLRALPLLPPDLIRVVWNNGLTNPPLSRDPVVNGNLVTFRNYFLNTWLPNREKLELWNHWATEDVRTTNHAEGYHNGLSSSFETRCKAPLGVFLGIMQSVHNEIEVRIRQLLRGEPPISGCPGTSRMRRTSNWRRIPCRSGCSLFTNPKSKMFQLVLLPISTKNDYTKLCGQGFSTTWIMSST